MHKSQKKKWTNKEIKMLKYLYLDCGLCLNEIVLIIDRTKSSIRVKIKRLNLKHNSIQKVGIKRRIMYGKNNPMYGRESWCKGLTKETNDIVKSKSEKTAVTKKRLYRNGTLNISGENNPMYGKEPWSKGLTKETDDILRKSGEKSSLTKKRQWLKLPEIEKEKKRKHCAIIGAKCKKKRTSIELKIENFLAQRGVKFISNHYKDHFVFDFYLLEYNMVIECQGDYWHANPIKYGQNNTNSMQKKNIERDERKKTYLRNNNITSIFIWEYDINKNFEKIKDLISNTMRGNI